MEVNRAKKIFCGNEQILSTELNLYWIQHITSRQ